MSDPVNPYGCRIDAVNVSRIEDHLSMFFHGLRLKEDSKRHAVLQFFHDPSLTEHCQLEV